MENTCTNSYNLLDIIIHLYFKHPKLFKENNFLYLKQTLYCWVICDPTFKGRELKDLAVQYTHLTSIDLNISYNAYQEIDTLVTVIYRFINMNEREWFDSVHKKLIHWTALDKVDKNSILVIVLNYIDRTRRKLNGF